ncbi:MAG: hypothetical protein KAV83_08215 [Desulfobacterales bacterium]|nr:hypothetical protein [Desulfobacterales bacterium]
MPDISDWHPVSGIWDRSLVIPHSAYRLEKITEIRNILVPPGTFGPDLSVGTHLAAASLVGFGHTLQKPFEPTLFLPLF